VKGDDPRAAFTEDARQKIESVDAGAGTLTVRTVGREEGQPGPSEVDPAYLSANPLVDSADARVQSHVKRALERVGDEPWAKVEAIEKWVFQNLRRKNFQIAFAPAARVAQELQGDCTEHSVLFAAMARAAGIPTRCVVGVVYVADQGGFGPHMWNEVYVNGRWTAVDATFDQTEVDAAHLKFSDSSLDGVAAFEALLPVLRVFNKLEIEPIEIR
jgi:transglutaminase-like putative cysteine protease